MPVQAESVRTVFAIRELIEAANSLAAAIRLAARTVHSGDPTPPVQREILAELADHGPRAVPDLAAARNVTRQNIQVAVNGLESRGFVQRLPNPRHRRSPLVELTPSGRAAVVDFRRREGRVASAMAADLDPAELTQAASTLRRLRDRIDRETRPKPA